MKKLFVMWILIGLSLIPAYVFGQGATNQQIVNEQNGRDMQAQEFGRRAAPPERNLIGTNADATTSIFVVNRFYSPEVKLSRSQKAALKPDQADFIAYKSSLKLPDTHLIKLFPDQDCETSDYVIQATQKCLDQVPYSDFYSFRQAKYTIKPLSDIHYKDGMLVSDGLLVQGLLTNLNNASFETLTPDSPQLKSLTAYKPEGQIDASRQQLKTLMTGGIKLDGYNYKNTWQVIPDTTYVMRVVAYRGNAYKNIRGQLYDIFDYDKRQDIIVAFKVVRKNDDGSLTLIWRKLTAKESPRIYYSAKRNKTKYH